MKNKQKLLLVGWDAADWQIIGPLLAKGLMPSLKKIIDNGVYGNMSTMNPPYSPMLWTSVATGKTANKHGVLGFVEIMPDLEGVRSVTTHSRKTRAIWNMFHNKGLKTNLVGWWPSFPTEPINGVIVSDKFQKVHADPEKRKPIHPDAIHPKEALKDFHELRMFPTEVTPEHILPFIPNAAKINQSKDHLLVPFASILSHNVSVHNAATRLLRTTEWDFMGVYYDMIDHFCHTFMKFHPPKQVGIDQDKFDIYKDVINAAYRFQDMMLGRKLQLIDDDTTVLVMSDHGYESGSRRIMEMPKLNAAPALEHRNFGMFAAMGPNIKKNTKLYGLGLMDIAPTILHHFNLPIGKDMDGRVIGEMFKNFKNPEYIKSWDLVEGDFGELDKNAKTDVLSDQEAMQQLIDLGYIDAPDQDKTAAIRKTRCDLQHNLATVYKGNREYDKAEKILLELIKEKAPIDVTQFYRDLVAIKIAKKEFLKAAEYFNKMKEVNTQIRYNLFFIESEILEGLGYTDKALKVLQDALSERSDISELWYCIGVLQYKMGDFILAKSSFENAIERMQDMAKYHRVLAETLYKLKEYEEAVDYAITSIELVHNVAAAHYILAQSLEKLGDFDNAKTAYTTAKSLRYMRSAKEKMAIENIEEKLEEVNLVDKGTHKYRENQIVLVSGLPRSGTSLMMQMLSKGGMDTLIDDLREADISNPKGYFEYEPVMKLHKNNDWLGTAQNKVVKIVAPLLKHLDPQYRYKIIFMKRDLGEIIKSQQIMTGKHDDVMPVTLFNSYVRLLQNIESWKEQEPHIDMVYVDYKDILENTNETLEKLLPFIGVPLEKEAMANCIDPTLYRNRSST
ncbi:alkaline phosphatase family protein [Flavobacteriaceae bacterium]|jgi:predicted AlkP superfamily phosphohydrolase/phosphomutase/Tfp pilus assembly protein PilF|nr:alkaline phosphatase family protein [Flavobacteriaceae bacterium]MDB4325213.1 alkaline phosphatase family protein [Flavobacteriaceae bacterium]|tara:strand:- start:309 stop:2843 length:2535 start_codon:yes stop_codon:yes gene_type:complete